MISKIFISFLFLASFAVEAKSLKAFSFNLHCTFDNWQARVDEIARYLAKTQPDIISFQEVCEDQNNNMPKGIIEALKRHGYPVVSVERQNSHLAWDKYDELQMVISRRPTEETYKGLLPKSPLQRAYVALKIDGIWFVNVHLEHNNDNAKYRAEQVMFLIEKFKNQPHMIMGDYNSSTTSPEQAPFAKKGYASYFPGLTYPASNASISIDGFWLSPQLRPLLTNERSEIILKERYMGTYLSDHFAVEFQAEILRP